MRTETRSLILEIISSSPGTRPVDLARRLEITPQAIHRHLKALVLEGRVATRGRGPQTVYVAGGEAERSEKVQWYPRELDPAIETA